MPEGLQAALDTPGLWFVLTVSLGAGLVYGFAGFGSALIFMPSATLALAPALAIAAFSLSALASLVTVIPGAWRAADKRGTVMMIAACMVFTPFGVAALRLLPAATIQAAIAVLTLATLALLLAGWKLSAPGRGARLGVGALAGLTGGSTGLNGPPVILFNLAARDQSTEVTRGNLACFLTLTSLSFLPQLWLQGLLTAQAFWLGVLLLFPYALGTMVGARLFRPAYAVLYRRLAYALIGAAGAAALPIWGKV